MAVIFVDGFDHIGNRNPHAFKKWGVNPVAANIGGIIVNAAPPVKNGTHSLKIPSGEFIVTNKFGPFNGVIVGFHVYFPSLPNTGVNLINILHDELRHISLRVDPASRRFEVIGPNDVSMAFSKTVIGAGIWYHIEFRVGLSKGSGTCRFRVNMKTEINFSSADTSHEDGVWNRVLLSGIIAGSPTVIDDFYLSNLDGPAPYNNFLGAARIETIFPEFGNGSWAEFEVHPVGETEHGKQVDEIAPNTFDYNSAPKHRLDTESNRALRETYNYPNIQPLKVVDIDGVPTPERIMGVQVNPYIQRGNDTNMHINSIMRTDTDYFGPDQETEEFWKHYTSLYQTNPNGNVEWTEAAVNTMQVGVRAFEPEFPPL